MGNKRIETPFDQVTFKVIGCAMAVHRKLGPGLRENTYQRAMKARLAEAAVMFTDEERLEVYENGILVGYYYPDFIVNDVLPVEIKARYDFDKSNIAQIIGYMAVLNAPVGLLINFGRRSLQWRRILPPKEMAAHPVHRQWLVVPDWLKRE